MKLCVVFFENAGNIIRHETSVNIFVDKKNRCKTARTDAAAGFEREFAVRRAFAFTDTQNFGEFVVNVARAFYITGRTETDRNIVAALGIECELCIEGDDLIYFFE